MAKKIGNLNALEFALSQLIDEPQADDEFTADEFIAAAKEDNQKSSTGALRHRIRRMCENGLLKKRMVRINGHLTNLYTKA